MKAGRRLLLLIATLASFTVVGWCQGSLGGITGRVTDPSGAAIPEATVVITGLDTSVPTSVGTTSDGAYLIPSVAPGRYRISITKTGFKVFTQEPIIISTATVITLDITLTVGAVTETVRVTAQAAELQTSSAEVGTVMPSQAMLDLPIGLGGNATIGASGRRQIESFTFLTPGVQGNQWQKRINGAPGMSQDILIDGITMLNIGAPGMIAEGSPPYEAVAEFKVQNTLYPAEYGQGFGIINFTMKSGTNKYHGDLFEFVRNDKFDARGFFAPFKNTLRQNEFGGTFGGPLSIPKLYNGRNRTFFFVAYSGFRLRGGLPSAGTTTIPSLQERTGDFSDYPYPIFDPMCGDHRCAANEVRTQFPNNLIPADRISAVAARATALLPDPDISGTWNNNYYDRSSSPTTDDAFSLKIDHSISAKQQLSGAYWGAWGNTRLGGGMKGPLELWRNNPTAAGGLRVNQTYMITPTLLNHAGFGYTWTSPTWSFWKEDPTKGNQVLQIPGIPADANGFPEFEIDQYAQWGNAYQQGGDPKFFQNWSAVDDLSWVKGKHTVKVGAMYRRRRISVDDKRNVAGTFGFNRTSTSQPTDADHFSAWGNGYASVLLGEVMYSSRLIPAPLRHFTDQFWAAYAEDTIKVTPKFTLTLGLRYELPIYVHEEDGNLSKASLSAPNPDAGGLPGALTFLGYGEGREDTLNIFGAYHKSFSPRLGLAYELNNKTVVRAGYGLFRTYINVGRMENCGYWCSGFGLTPSFSSSDSGVTPAFYLDDGFPVTNETLPNLDPSLNNNGTITWVNSSSGKPATMQSWTLAIQRQLPFNFMLDVAYVGSHATGLWTGLENVNQVNPIYLSLGDELNANIGCLGSGTCLLADAAGVTVPYVGFTGSVAQALRPYPQFARVRDWFQPTGHNRYHSMQVRLQKTYSSGLSFLGAYTLSKNTGVSGGDTFGDGEGAAGLGSLNTYNQRAERGLISWDQTHILNFSWSYALPFGRGRKFLANSSGVVNQLLGGWQINAVQTYQSGTPISVGGGVPLPIFGGGNRPDWISSQVRTSTSLSDFDPSNSNDRYLDVNAFRNSAPYTFGNAPAVLPNTRYPALYNENFSVFKQFSLGAESRFLEFRAEFFNLFNRVQFGGIPTDINDPTTFGRIYSQANTPRVIQFALKLVF